MIESSEPSITLKMIIDSGILKSGIKVYSVTNEKNTGILNADGSITLEIKNEVRNFPFPSGAARAIENRSLNGWIYWTIKESNSYKELSYYRNLYEESKKTKG